MKKTPVGKISTEEGLKSARDAIILAVGGLIPQLLEIVQAVDFGDYTAMVSLGIAVLTPIINTRPPTIISSIARHSWT